MAEKSRQYWKKRFKAMEKDWNNNAKIYLEEIIKEFDNATFAMQAEIEKWIWRIADNNEISYTGAKRLLKKNELEEFNWKLKQYIKKGKENAINEEWIKELENASAKYHITRLEALKLQAEQHVEMLYWIYNKKTTEFICKEYTNVFYRTVFEMQKGYGVGYNFAKLDARRIDKAIKSIWAIDEKNFSDRIWDNKRKLINTLHTNLTQSIIRGEDAQKAIDSIKKTMNTSKTNAGRLVMTESAAIASTAQKECFEGLGLDKYEIVATLDSNTSEICRGMDGKKFDMKDYKIGLTAPPFHVWCRSTTVPLFYDDLGYMGERAARATDGKTYFVPADMTYKEWKEKYVDKGE